MATEVWCELVCASCAYTASGQYTTDERVPRKALKEEATRRGWVFQGTQAFCSERCRIEYRIKEQSHG